MPEYDLTIQKKKDNEENTYKINVPEKEKENLKGYLEERTKSIIAQIGYQTDEINLTIKPSTKKKEIEIEKTR